MRLRRHADAHADHARELFARLTAAPSVRDAARAAHLRILLGADAGPVLAFTHSADTARALGHLLRDLGGVAALTADGAEIADGRLSRREALVRFAPRAQGAPAPHARDAIRLLIATDLLAEGLNLQDARVVVHLDVPWTPARLEQRVGRVARPGSPHETVRILRIAPPASAEAITHAERTLRAKLAEAERVVGALPLALGAGESASIRDNSRRASPGPSVLTAAANELEARELVRARLAAWRAAGSRARANGEPADDTVRFASNETTADVSLLVTAGGTWIASVRAPAANPAHRPHLVAGGLGAADATMRAQVEAASDHPLALLAAIEHVARAAQLATSAPHAEAALAAWRRHRDGAVAAGLDAPTSPSPTQRHALARVSAAVALAPPHLRAHRASLAERARALLRLPASAQRDSLIQSLTACHPADDDHWLLALATCAANDAPPV
ncbi:MAG: hypothetical protein HY275_04360 [Gemmatimonadetes bacterium]|nr:hypothetical protein [Gemmatimonadota bacterium]